MSGGRHSGRFYALLLRLLPADFRESFGPDMEQLYRDQIGALERADQRLGYRVATVLDVVTQAAIEWTERARAGARDWTTGGTGMDGWKQDLRFGWRSLRRRPGFTIAAALTLTLGIGATVAIFTVVNGVLLHPLPYPDSDDLVVLWTRNTESGTRSTGFDHPDVRALQASVPGLALAGYAGTRPTLTGTGDPQVVLGAQVTDGLIELMGLRPALGRDLRASDDVPGGPSVMVVSHDFWLERLAGDRDAIGSTVRLNDEAWEIVGVAPPGFDFPDRSEIWQPRRHGDDGCDHGCRILSVVGRIDAGRSPEAVGTALAAASERLVEEYPDVHRDELFEMESMLQNEVADVQAALWVLLAAVGTVLLIACANVANLLLARANGRRTEVALRTALGASRLRIVRQLLTENAIIAVAAGIGGLLLARWGTVALIAMAPEGLPRLEEARMSGSVFAFAALLVVCVTALFGVLPALHTSGGSAARGGRRSAGGAHAGRSRSVLLVAEVALSLTLLLGAGLLLRTLGEIRAVDLGFDTERIERFRISLPEARYDSLAVGTFLGHMEDELERLPQVAAAGWGFGVPLASGNVNASAILLDRPMVAPPDRPVFDLRPATEGFLDATGTRLVRGRWFDEGDRYGNQPVAVINQAAVRAHYSDRDPIGLLIAPEVTWGFDESPEMTIVGVVGDVVRGRPTEEPAPAVYVPNAQFGANTGYWSIRLADGVDSAILEIRRVVGQLDPSLAIWDISTMEQDVAESRATAVFYTTLLSIFSVVALALAAVGLYGVVAYAATQRTREIGIRMALGAAAEDVTGMVLREGIRPALTGIVVGLVLSWFAARLLGSLLFGVSWGDPLSLVGACAALLAVTAVASAIPARRASRVPPVSALRAE